MTVSRCPLAPLYALRKDHKVYEDFIAGPPVRPVCGVVVSYNQHLSYLLSSILTELWRDEASVCMSTEEMAAGIREVNEMKLEEDPIIGLADVKALYPSLDIDFTVEKACELFQESDVREVKKQRKGGAIGLELTGVLAQLFMIWWDRELRKYEVEGDKQKSNDKISMRLLQEIGNRIHESIEITVDYPSKHDGGKLPILDLKAYKNMKSKDQAGKVPLYRPREWRRKEGENEKRNKRNNWHKKGGYSSVVSTKTSEAVLINKVKAEMNTKKEWNFANIPRARIN
ncbi:hypothetical protein AC249_AIPGENE20467 [Exaiptasia diaphana]|nr:hypothetical protein AC249_AIPGENE20467 [Exaiptasia diaphana]